MSGISASGSLTSADLARVAEVAGWQWFRGALRRRLHDGDRMTWRMRFEARAVSLFAFWRRNQTQEAPEAAGRS